MDISVSSRGAAQRDRPANAPLGVSVDDLNAACQRFEDHNVNWQKRLTDGRMKSVAFVLDPDGYWIEIIAKDMM